MAKKAPVGTVRHWASGPVIKAHENSPMKEAWIVLPANSQVFEIGRQCDTLANAIINYDIPLNGEKYLDREIREFKKEDGKEGPYHPGDFKQYRGFYGNTSYSFISEFNRRAMSPRLDLESKINDALWDELKQQRSNRNNDNYMLDSTEIKTVKEKVKSGYNYSGPVFDIQEAVELKEVVKKVYQDVKRGLEFEGDEKVAYTAAKNLVDRLPLEYDKLKVKKQSYDNALEIIHKFFGDNWAVEESFKGYAKDKYRDYLTKFREEIKLDSIEEQKEIFGTTIDAPTEEFYTKLMGKLQENSSLDYFDLLELRFEDRLNIQLDGEWKADTLGALKIFEEISFELPRGHILSNDSLKRLKNNEYTNRGLGAYAYYVPSSLAISLSDKLLEKSSLYASKTDSALFKAVLVHEVGHSVSQKLGRQGSLPYKKFVVETGWSWMQDNMKDGQEKATGEEKAVIRQGRNHTIPLITDYASVSPEEAFAEYFSFYHNNKQGIDNLIKTGEDNLLPIKTISVTTLRADHRTVRDVVGSYSNLTSERLESITREVDHISVSDRGSRITLTAEDPFYVKVASSEQFNLKKETVRWRKDQDFSSMPPVLAITKTDGGKLIVDGVNRVLQSKLNRHAVPTISVTQELYKTLVEKGYTKPEIVGYAYSQMKDEVMPNLRESAGVQKVKGIQYGEDFVPLAAVKRGVNAFRAMKTIYESDELKKALQNLGEYISSL